MNLDKKTLMTALGLLAVVVVGNLVTDAGKTAYARYRISKPAEVKPE